MITRIKNTKSISAAALAAMHRRSIRCTEAAMTIGPIKKTNAEKKRTGKNNKKHIAGKCINSHFYLARTREQIHGIC